MSRANRRQYGFSILGVGGVFVTVSAAPIPDLPWILSGVALYSGLGLVAGGLLLLAFSLQISLPLPEVEYEFRYIKRNELPKLMRFARRFLEELPPLRTVKAIYRTNPKCFWVAERHSVSRWSESRKWVGFFSVLPMQAAAVDLLEREELTGLRFTSEHITTLKQQPKALYVGSIAARGFKAKAETLGYIKACVERAVDVGIRVVYTRPVSRDGLRLVRRHDFLPVSDDVEPNELGRVYKREYEGQQSDE